MVFKCLTCQSGDDLFCCCKACSEICHKDHEIEYIGFGNAYCDCHTGQCILKSELRQHSFDGYLLSQNFRDGYRKVLPFEIENLNSSAFSRYALSLVDRSKETFWISSGSEPRFALEQLAKRIGDFHLNRLARDKALPMQLLSTNSGYEWWVQARKSCERDSGRTGVDLHYDKDEDIAETFGVGMFPVVSTVTYLAYNSVQLNPTVVFDASITTPIGAPIQNCYISVPSNGKHIAFAGDLLHGAPHELIDFAQVNSCGIDLSSPSEFPRITFLVNIWVGHKPSRVEPISIDFINEICQSLDDKSLFERFNLKDSEVDYSTVEISSKNVENDEDGDWSSIPFISDKSSWGKEEDESGVEMIMWLPSKPLEFLNKKAGRKRNLSSKDNTLTAPSTFHLKYPKHVAPRLEYEFIEDEFVEEIESSMNI